MSRREQSWLWLIFAGSILGSAYLHELGHCIPAWVQGYPAIPTPAKEYILAAVTDPVQRAIALGGVLGSVLAFLGALWLYGGCEVVAETNVYANLRPEPIGLPATGENVYC